MPKKKSVWIVTYRDGNKLISQRQTKSEAFRIARAKSKDLYKKYSDVGIGTPTELHNYDGSVIFHLSGLELNVCPRVEEDK